MAQQDPISAFTADGLRWVLSTLKARTEVAAVMEAVLDTVEHWSMTVDTDRLSFELQQAQDETARLKDQLAELEEARATQQRDIEQNRTEARDLREKVAQDLLMLSRDLASKDALQRRVNELQRSLERVPLLEKELQKTQKDLKDAQKRLSHVRSYAERGGMAMTGRQSPNPLDRLMNGHAPRSSPTPASSYISVANKHTLFTTFMTIEEKLLLKVFSYLNAVDVLATAEVCKSFYERVGAIFGKPGTMSGSSSNNPSSAGLGMSASGSKAGGIEAGAGDSGPLPPSRASVAAKAVLDESPITEKVATSIASKLTSSEMKGIIGLTEKLKKLEAVVLAMQAENEDLRARLQGTESVKDFLISKLKDTEVALKKSLDGTSGAARQRASDQEVISFLDGRVQELEQALQETGQKLEELDDKHERDRLANLEQVRVLNDMLQYERHKGEEAEGQFKAQKKLLAKEIKSLRSEVLARQSERDGYRDQLKELRQSVALQFGRTGGGR